MRLGFREATLLLTLGCIGAQSEHAQDLTWNGVCGRSSVTSSLSVPFASEECDDLQVEALLQIKSSSSPGDGARQESRMALYTSTRRKSSMRRLANRARQGILIVSICVLGASVLVYHSTEVDEAKEETVPCERALQEQEQEQPCQTYTKWEAIFAFSNIGVGSSLCAIPFCLSRAGAAGFGMLALTGLVAGITAASFAPSFQVAHLHADVSAQRFDGWHIISHEAFGPIGLWMTLILIPLDIGLTSLNCVLIGGNVLPEILPQGTSKNAACVICGAIAFILTLCPPAWAPRIAVVGSFATSAIIASLIATGVSILRPGSTASLGVHGLVFEMDTVVGFFGVFLAGFNVHQFLPFFYKRLRHKSEWDAVVGSSISLYCGFYLLVGMIAFYLFGDSTKEIFVHNLGRDGRDNQLQGLEHLAPFCSGLVAIQQISMLPTVVQALVDEFPLVGRQRVASGCIGICVLLAMFGQRVLPYIVALEGTTIDFQIAILIPILAYLSLKWGDLTLCWKCVLFIFLLLCSAGTFLGAIIDSEVIAGVKVPLDKD